jgi:dihydrofolate reductase
MMVSMDGYFEGEGHDLSWHNVDEEFNNFVHAQNASIGTILFGRRTYEMMAAFWPTSQGSEADKLTADFMTATQKVVISDTPLRSEWANTRVVNEQVNEEIAKLKAEPGNDIAMFGSNALCVSLMEAGLVDEFRVMISPVAIGKGTPVFEGLSKKIKFKLVDSRTFKSGNVLNRYVI